MLKCGRVVLSLQNIFYLKYIASGSSLSVHTGMFLDTKHDARLQDGGKMPSAVLMFAMTSDLYETFYDMDTTFFMHRRHYRLTNVGVHMNQILHGRLNEFLSAGGPPREYGCTKVFHGISKPFPAIASATLYGSSQPYNQKAEKKAVASCWHMLQQLSMETESKDVDPELFAWLREEKPHDKNYEIRWWHPYTGFARPVKMFQSRNNISGTPTLCSNMN